MKTGVAYILLLVFSASVALPYMPYMYYSLHRKMIEERLCVNRYHPERECHGSCILNEEIRKIYEKSGDASIPPSSQKISLPKFDWTFITFSDKYVKYLGLPKKRALSAFLWIFSFFPKPDTPPPKNIDLPARYCG